MVTPSGLSLRRAALSTDRLSSADMAKDCLFYAVCQKVGTNFRYRLCELRFLCRY